MIREPRLLRRWYGHYQTRLIDLPILLAGGLLASIWIGDIWWQLFASYAIVVRYINRVGLGERDVFTCPLIEQRNHLTIPATP